MTDQIKNRVVGTIVIFALAIIFLPDILDGKKQRLRDDFDTIPVKPQYQAPQPKIVIEQISISNNETVENPAVPVKNKTVVSATNRKSANQNSVIVSKPSSEPVIKSVVKKLKKQAWVITVGSFKDPKNVKSLLSKLRKNGFTAFSVPSKPRINQTSKVFDGPALDKATLVKLQPKLKALINEAGFLSAYNPLEK